MSKITNQNEIINDCSLVPDESRQVVPIGNYAVEVNGIMVLARVKSKRGGLYIKDVHSREDASRIFRALDETNLEQARKSYGQISERCYKCHRPLRDPVSLERGIGPVCRIKEKSGL